MGGETGAKGRKERPKLHSDIVCSLIWHKSPDIRKYLPHISTEMILLRAAKETRGGGEEGAAAAKC